MIKFIFLFKACYLVVFQFLVTPVFAQSWQTLGKELPLNSECLSVKMCKKGEIFIVVKDGEKNNSIGVKKIVGKKILDLGKPGFASDDVKDIFIAVDNSNVPFLIFKDNKQGLVHIKWLNVKEWRDINCSSFPTSVSEVSVLFDASNFLWIAFNDIKKNRIVVKKLVGKKWEEMGLNCPAWTIGKNITLSLGQDNGIYLSYVDINNRSRIMVKNFSGNIWVPYGSLVEGVNSELVSITFDSSNTPYILYREIETRKVGMKKLQKEEKEDVWVNVGTPFSVLGNGFLTMVIDNDLPYIIYKDKAEVKCIVKKIEGENWVDAAITETSAKGVSGSYIFLSNNKKDIIRVWVRGNKAANTIAIGKLCF